MKLLDVNVVLAAQRADHPQHVPALAYVQRLLDERETFAVPDLVAGSYLRITTNRRIFSVPTPLTEAFAFLEALRAAPGHVLIGPGADHLGLLRQVCVGHDAAGDLVPDAQLATLALEHAAQVVSYDRDFARFASVRWTRPDDAAA